MSIENNVTYATPLLNKGIVSADICLQTRDM